MCSCEADEQEPTHPQQQRLLKEMIESQLSPELKESNSSLYCSYYYSTHLQIKHKTTVISVCCIIEKMCCDYIKSTEFTLLPVLSMKANSHRLPAVASLPFGWSCTDVSHWQNQEQKLNCADPDDSMLLLSTEPHFYIHRWTHHRHQHRCSKMIRVHFLHTDLHVKTDKFWISDTDEISKC